MTVPKSHREASKEVVAHPGRAFACSHPKLRGLLRLGAVPRCWSCACTTSKGQGGDGNPGHEAEVMAVVTSPAHGDSGVTSLHPTPRYCDYKPKAGPLDKSSPSK